MDGEIRDILLGVQQGTVSVDQALLHLKQKPFEDLGYAKMDMEFSQFCGILLASFVYLCCYCIYKKNKPDVYVKSIFPGFLSGLMWAVAQTGWFYANAMSSPVVTFPIICCGPTIVSSIWGMTLYKEITGTKNAILLAIVVCVMIAGAVCVALSQ